MNNVPKVVTQQRRGRATNPRLLDRKSDALPLSHRATLKAAALSGRINMVTFANLGSVRLPSLKFVGLRVRKIRRI